MNKDVQQYFNRVPKQRQPLIKKLHALILELYPDAEQLIWYNMPTYRAKSGWVSLANQEHYVSLYTCSELHIAAFKTKHPKMKTGKACLNFRDTDQVPLEDVKRVVRHAIEHPK